MNQFCTPVELEEKSKRIALLEAQLSNTREALKAIDDINRKLSDKIDALEDDKHILSVELSETKTALDEATCHRNAFECAWKEVKLARNNLQKQLDTTVFERDSIKIKLSKTKSRLTKANKKNRRFKNAIKFLKQI